MRRSGKSVILNQIMDEIINLGIDLSDENTRNREFSAFDDIEDSEKYIITLTKEDYSNNEVKQINIFDFLMNDDF